MRDGEVLPPSERRASTWVDPPYLAPAYRSTALRAPARAPIRIPYGPTELAPISPPLVLAGRTSEAAWDLTKQHAGPPLGERIVVHGRVADLSGRPLSNAVVEVWQTNAAGRYAHDRDRHPAPLDPNFTGVGFCLTDDAGAYRFVTIKPGAYPWQNHPNAWRPAHIHFSVIGNTLGHRLITQMYFPGDPLLEHDPIYQAIADARARELLVAEFDLSQTVPEWALAYRFDITVGGRSAP